MTDEDEAADNEAYDKVFFGAGVVAVLTVGGFALSWADKFAKAREARALDGLGDIMTSWQVGDASSPVMLVFLPLLLVPILFYPSWTGSLSTLARLIGTGLAVAVALAGLAHVALNGGRDLGVATKWGVTWLHDGKRVAQIDWSQATSINITCWENALTYDVSLPGGTAPLGRGTDDIGTWIENLSRIDGALRAAGVTRYREGDEACLTHYDEGLIPSEKARFRAIMAG